MLIKRVIDYEIKRSTHIRHITLEHFIRVDRKFQPVQIQPEVGSKILPHLRIFIILLFTRRKAQAFEIGKSLGTRGIHRLSTVTAEKCLILRKKVDILLFRFHTLTLPILS